MKKSYALVLVLLVAFCLHLAEGASQEAEPISDEVRPVFNFRPVVNEGQRDGLLLGGEFGLGVEALQQIFQIKVGLALGLKSGLPRLRTSVNISDALNFSYGDWPETQMLGREGEQGVHIAVDLFELYQRLDRIDRGFLTQVVKGSQFRGTGFVGNLWPNRDEEESPEVRYGHLNAVIRWPLSRNYSIQTIGELLIGNRYGQPENSFQSFSSASKLTLNQLMLEVQVAEAQNVAELPGFQLDLGLRSYPEDITGDRFVIAKLERKFDIFAAHVWQLDLSNLLGPELGWLPIKIAMESIVFFESAALLSRENKVEEILFGWGTSLVFPDLQMRLDLAINKEGSPSLRLETGVVPAF